MFHSIALISNGLNPNGPLPTAMSNYGLGDSKMCQDKWIQLLDYVCKFNNAPHGDMGFNVEIKIKCSFICP